MSYYTHGHRNETAIRKDNFVEANRQALSEMSNGNSGRKKLTARGFKPRCNRAGYRRARQSQECYRDPLRGWRLHLFTPRSDRAARQQELTRAC